MLFLFPLQVCGLNLSVSDLKNAFCQSNSLDRSTGPLNVEPCESLNLPPGSLIQLVSPVYGLNDAPLRWHRLLTAWLIRQGYRKSLLEPCLYTHCAPGGGVDGLSSWKLTTLQQAPSGHGRRNFNRGSRPRFASGSGKNGRPDTQADEFGSEISMCWSIRKSISWRSFIQCSCVRNCRRTEGLLWTSLNVSAHSCTRSAGCRRKAAPRLSRSASILAQHLKAPIVSDVLIANRVVKFLRASASQMSHRLAPRSEGTTCDLSW